jgi:hypothetical protein
MENMEIAINDIHRKIDKINKKMRGQNFSTKLLFVASICVGIYFYGEISGKQDKILEKLEKD